jgi:hypothetical protein
VQKDAARQVFERGAIDIRIQKKKKTLERLLASKDLSSAPLRTWHVGVVAEPFHHHIIIWYVGI